jgi:hypothetical protein
MADSLSREFPSCITEYWRVAAIICHYAAADVIRSIMHSSKLTQDLTALSTAEWALWSVTMQQCNFEHLCRYYTKVLL